MKKLTRQFEITMEDTAVKQDSGDLFVLSTPRLIAYMESVAKSMVDACTVGVHISLEHTAPSPQGALITITAEIIEETNHSITFSLTAKDCLESIATAKHVRVIVDGDRLQKRADAKLLPNPSKYDSI